MRVAVCFSGQLRNVKSTFDGWYQQNVLAPNNHHRIDFFGHSWFDKETIGTIHYAANRNPNTVVASDPVPENVVQDIYKLYNPVVLQLQHQKYFDEKNYNERRLPDAVPQNGLSRLYSLMRSVQLKKQYEVENGFEYDVVACARYDFMFLEPFRFDMVVNDVVYHPGYSPHGFNVCYAMGKSKIMDIYANLYTYIDTVFSTGVYWCDELLTMKYLELCGIPVQSFDVRNNINRGTQS